MQREEINPGDLVLRPAGLWASQWLLLTAGDFAAGDYNCMTVAWGSLGTMWDRPFAMIVVRPTRHTYGYLERSDSFTLCAFPAEHRDTLLMLGTKSGRDGDKIGESGLTPIASTKVASPSFAEAELVLECQKLYFDDYEPKRFVQDFIHGLYDHDYHRMYFGHIVAALGTRTYAGGA
jgi:flavin reductase (DIM6/NTAB) family NADH-FMN oxidoreductase RutF